MNIEKILKANRKGKIKFEQVGDALVASIPAWDDENLQEVQEILDFNIADIIEHITALDQQISALEKKKLTLQSLAEDAANVKKQKQQN